MNKDKRQTANGKWQMANGKWQKKLRTAEHRTAEL
jgi:hypothetical protein